MGCKGRCEIKQFRFTWSDALVVAASPNAPPLTGIETVLLIERYFAALRPDHECLSCGDGCECVPLRNQPPEVGSARYDEDLPEPIVAVSGPHIYTLTGKVGVRAWITEGLCTRSFDPESQDKPWAPESQQAFDIKKTFRPKADSGRCGCRCDRQVYEFHATDRTTVTPKDGAPPLGLRPSQLEEWIVEQLKKTPMADQYPPETIGACTGPCECHALVPERGPPGQPPPPDTVTVRRKLKLDPPIEVVVLPDPTSFKSNNYVIAGEIEVVTRLVRGVCVPRLASVMAPADGH